MRSSTHKRVFPLHINFPRDERASASLSLSIRNIFPFIFFMLSMASDSQHLPYYMSFFLGEEKCGTVKGVDGIKLNYPSRVVV